MLRSRTYTKIFACLAWLSAAIILLTKEDSKDGYLEKVQQKDEFFSENYDSDSTEKPITVTESVESHFGHLTEKNSTKAPSTTSCDFSLSKEIKNSYSKRLRTVLKNHYRVSSDMVVKKWTEKAPPEHKLEISEIWFPSTCKDESIAIIVPFQDSKINKRSLEVFSIFVPEVLQASNIEFKIYIIQDDECKLSKMEIFKLGVEHAKNEHDWKCFLFHDFNLVPKNLNFRYQCRKHASTFGDNFKLFRASADKVDEIFETSTLDGQMQSNFNEKQWNHEHGGTSFFEFLPKTRSKCELTGDKIDFKVDEDTTGLFTKLKLRFEEADPVPENETNSNEFWWLDSSKKFAKPSKKNSHLPLCPKVQNDYTYEQTIDDSQKVDFFEEMKKFAHPRYNLTNEFVHTYWSKNLTEGGYYCPKNCKPRSSNAIIIPFRGNEFRDNHLRLLGYFLPKFLIAQDLEFQIYIIEQSWTAPFSRATLYNIGLIEALKDRRWDCVTIHDVDKIPTNPKFDYNCRKNSAHLAVVGNNFLYVSFEFYKNGAFLHLLFLLDGAPPHTTYKS